MGAGAGGLVFPVMCSNGLIIELLQEKVWKLSTTSEPWRFAYFGLRSWRMRLQGPI